MNSKRKVAVIFAACGAVAGAVAEAVAHEVAQIFLSGRNRDRVQEVADNLRREGLTTEAACVDAIDAPSVEKYIDGIAARTGRIDFLFNGIGTRPTDGGYGLPAEMLTCDQFVRPFSTHVVSQFLTARAAARHMRAARTGVVLTLSASLSRDTPPFMAGVAGACAAIEAMTRSLAREWGRDGVRVVCLRPTAMPETRTIRETITAHARTLGIPPEVMAASIRESSLLKRDLTLSEMGDVAAFLASDAASAITGQVIDVSCGQVVT